MQQFRNKVIFVDMIPKNININKTDKSFYFKSFLINNETITKFISGLPKNEIFLVSPFISRYDLSSDPCLLLSKQFLITSETNPNLITNYLNKQFNKSSSDLLNQIIQQRGKTLNYYFSMMDFNFN
jgi:hypothetical protein